MNALAALLLAWEWVMSAWMKAAPGTGLGGAAAPRAYRSIKLGEIDRHPSHYPPSMNAGGTGGSR